MKKKKTKITRSDFFALIAILISIIPIIKDFYDDKNTKSENIILHRDFVPYQSTILSEGLDNRDMAALFSNTQYITISNNSERDVSITKLRVDMTYNNHTFSFPQIVEESDLSLPVNISAHNSIATNITFNYPINIKALKILLMNGYELGKEYELDDIIKLLGSQNTDLFGNTVKFSESGGDSYSINLPADYKHPLIILNLLTSENKSFEISLPYSYSSL